MESPQTARSTYVAKCGEQIQGLDPLLDHEQHCPNCRRTLPFEVVCSLTGDRAQADTADAALAAAAQLCRDHQDAVGTHGALKAARATLYVVENGTYAGILTQFARLGHTNAEKVA